MGAVLGWWDLLPWQLSYALVMSHGTDPKGPRRSGKLHWQQPLQSSSITCSRGAVAIMSPYHLLGQSTETSPSTFPFWAFPSSAKWVWQPPPPVCCQSLPALSSSVFPTAEPCRLPLDEGDCQRYTLRWYYNQRVTECRPFVYSGCQGNLNRFDSKEECELRCGPRPGPGRQSVAHQQVQQHLHLVLWAQQCRAGGAVLVPHLSSDSALLLSTDSPGSAGSKVGGQPKV